MHAKKEEGRRTKKEEGGRGGGRKEERGRRKEERGRRKEEGEEAAANPSMTRKKNFLNNRLKGCQTGKQEALRSIPVPKKKERKKASKQALNGLNRRWELEWQTLVC
jgi:hypothetical protein